MASNSRRRSASSGSRSDRRSGTHRRRAVGGATRASGRVGRSGNYGSRQVRGSARTSFSGYGSRRASGQPTLSSVSIGDIHRMEKLQRNERAQKRYRKYLIRLGIIVAVIVAVIGAGTALYFSPAFTIDSVEVEGAEHLTSSDMDALTAIPAGTTLLNVDTGAIERSVVRDAWVEDVSVERVFPSTLRIAVTERQIAAVVQVPQDNAKVLQDWAISSDGMWLMAIPKQDSEVGKTIAPQIYADAAEVLTITDVPYGVTPEIGAYCTDENINNALAIIDGLSPSFADQVKSVSATDSVSTLLTLDNGVQIAFGEAENIVEKENICMEIMNQNPGKVAYINVRVVDRPTWRSV